MKISLLLLSGFLFASVAAQNAAVKPDESKKIASNFPSQKITVQCKGFVNPPSTDLKWRPMLSTEFIESEPQSPNQEEIDQIKRDKSLLKQLSSTNRFSNTEFSTQTV